MAEKPKYRSVWQKMLQEEAAQTAAVSPDSPRLDYDLADLADRTVAPSVNPQLDYRLEGLLDTAPLGMDHDDPTDDIVVVGRCQSGHPTSRAFPRGTARAPFDGVVMRGMTGWQNRNNHGAGMGWRTWIQRSDGSRVGYGHLDPSSTLPEGTSVRRGDPVGRYGDPTNGRSTAPHLHVQAYDANGRLITPPAEDPFSGRGRRLGRYGANDRMHRGSRYPNGHQGDDWIEE